MAQRVIGLCGTGVGPAISLQQFKEPLVQVFNMKDGDKVVVSHADGTETTILENGEHSIPLTSLVQFRLEGTSKRALCFIIER